MARSTDSPEIQQELIFELTECATCSGNPRAALLELSDTYVQKFHGNPNPAPNPNPDPDPSLLGSSHLQLYRSLHYIALRIAKRYRILTKEVN